MTTPKFRTILKATGRGSGWRPDIPSSADYPLSQKLGALPRGLPESPSLKPEFFPKIRDQGELGSCTGHAARSCLAYKMREKHPDKLSGKWGERWDLSPLAAYWLGRREDNSIDVDVGCYIRDVVNAARKYGLPTEATWPYDPAKFKRKPTAKAFEEGKWHQAHDVATYRCDEDDNREKTVARMLQALAAGLPIEFGFACFPNLAEANDSGMIPMPVGRMTIEGGHAMTIYWADTPSRYFFGPNSWGRWGRKAPPGAKHDERGYFGVPFDYFLRGMADDAWAVELE